MTKGEQLQMISGRTIVIIVYKNILTTVFYLLFSNVICCSVRYCILFLYFVDFEICTDKWRITDPFASI